MCERFDLLCIQKLHISTARRSPGVQESAVCTNGVTVYGATRTCHISKLFKTRGPQGPAVPMSAVSRAKKFVVSVCITLQTHPVLRQCPYEPAEKVRWHVTTVLAEVELEGLDLERLVVVA